MPIEQSRKPVLGRVAHRPRGGDTPASLVREVTDAVPSWPVQLRPAMRGVDAVEWAAMQRDWLRARLTQAGAILLRGFPALTPAEFESFIRAISGDLLEYSQRSSPRSEVAGRIYTSTDYPPQYPIFFHNENSYQHAWPLKIFFMCTRPADTGGETPLSDVRTIRGMLRGDVLERFERLGVLYARSFSPGAGLTWQQAFQTSDRTAVEESCRARGIDLEWTPGDGLRMRQVRPAIVAHPVTREPLWFNHAAFFHVSTMPEDVRAPLMAAFAERDLPNNTYFGDGTPIPPEVVEHLRGAYRRASVSFPWQQGDILVLDNMMVAHGRSPFSGPRTVLVGMSELHPPA